MNSKWKKYSLFGIIRLCRDVLISRLNYPGVRIIRFPWYVRGARCIKIGKGFTSGVGLRMDAFGENFDDQIAIGENVEVGDYVHIGALKKVVIGNNCLLASRVYISDHDHGRYSGEEQSSNLQKQREKIININPVYIGNNVWIGEGVSILKGVVIGDNSIIGASSVVTKNIPANVIAVGSPARVIKFWDGNSLSWKSCND